MREIDSTGLILCKIQGELFVRSIWEMECSSIVFINRFMNSSIAKRFDSCSFLSDAFDNSSVLSEMHMMYDTHRGTRKFSQSSMYWIGYTYRYWCYTHQLSSRYVYSIIQAKEMDGLYQPYHTLSCPNAIERILEAKGLNEKPDPVEIFRRIRESK